MRRSPNPGAFDGADVEDAAELVDDQGRQRLALDFLGDDQERFARLGDLLEQGHHLAEAADLLLVEEDQGVLEDDLHRAGVRHEVGAQVSLVELHAFDEFEGGRRGLAFLDGDHAVAADPLDGVGQHVADLRVVIRGDGTDLGDLLLLGDRARELARQLGDGRLDGLLDAAADGGGVGPRGDALEPLAIDGAGQDGRGRGAVAGHVGGLGRDHVHELGAHVLERIGQLDLLRDRHAVLGDGRAAEGLAQDHVTPGRTESGPDRAGEDIHAFHHFPARRRRRVVV